VLPLETSAPACCKSCFYSLSKKAVQRLTDHCFKNLYVGVAVKCKHISARGGGGARKVREDDGRGSLLEAERTRCFPLDSGAGRHKMGVHEVPETEVAVPRLGA
jgi:hypothetical protein